MIMNDTFAVLYCDSCETYTTHELLAEYQLHDDVSDGQIFEAVYQCLTCDDVTVLTDGE